MDRKSFIAICDRKAKLVRAEYSLSQEKMALALGLSKKTLVEIEKGRSSLGWTGSVALCAIFCESETIASTFGGNPADIILALAFEGVNYRRQPFIGRRIWWQTVEETPKGIIQQNILSQHYRLLDREGMRIASSFDLEDLRALEGDV
ncbi:MAG: transcriptional regulator [Actinomycetia bacterium]|nr:transcriptional regulator [Actinomycetes bacterium]